MSTQPQVLKGFRDILPQDALLRARVMAQITSVFGTFGFLPIETPTLEYKSTIMGKYGDEADKLVYSFTDHGDREVALRYDQTVPTARFIANNFNDLSFPFRRYQTQNVFRADKPQKGRYREFTQCDIDIFGSTDPLADAEVLACTYSAYRALGFESVQIAINDRSTLVSILSPYASEKISVFSIIQSIDKLDKLPKNAVIDELVLKGLTQIQATQALKELLESPISPVLEQIMSLATALGISSAQLVYTPTLARGLDYYTGMIFEVRVPEFSGGSLGGGGRYDELIEQLAGIKMPAVGMAVGFDRTIDALIELGLATQTGKSSADRLMITYFEPKALEASLLVASQLRAQGRSVLVYPTLSKLDKQLKFADKNGIRYVIMIGEKELEEKTLILKDLSTREQYITTLEKLADL